MDDTDRQEDALTTAREATDAVVFAKYAFVSGPLNREREAADARITELKRQRRIFREEAERLEVRARKAEAELQRLKTAHDDGDSIDGRSLWEWYTEAGRLRRLLEGKEG